MDQSSYTIDEFCRAERISRATWYNLVAAGRSPRFYKIGARTVISAEARDEWRREREAAAAAEAKEFRRRHVAARTKRGAQP